MMLWREALDKHVDHTEIGWAIRSLDPLWVVCRATTWDDDEEAGKSHIETAFWCGTYWHFDWADEMLVYTHREAVMVAADVSERLVEAGFTPAYALSLGDYLRDEDRFMGNYFRDYKRRAGDPKHKTSIATLAALATEGRRTA